MYGAQKQKGLEEIVALTRKIIDVLEREEFDSVDDLMSRRQKIMDDITVLDSQVDMKMRETERQRLLPLLHTLQESDRKLAECIAIRKQEAAEVVQKFNVSRKLNHSYQSVYSNRDGYYIDQIIGSRK